MQKSILQFEHSPYLIAVCILTGLIYAFLLYQKKGPWSKQVNYVLGGLRFVLATLLAALVIGPIIKQLNNTRESPSIVLAIDNSLSINQVSDSTKIKSLVDRLSAIQEKLANKGFNTELRGLENKKFQDLSEIDFDNQFTDINGLLRGIQNDFEGRNLSDVILVSDGIFNTGNSPDFSTYNYNIHTVGIGDTIPKSDLQVKNLLYNKISYQGNKFPLIVETLNNGFVGQEARLNIKQGSKLLASKTVKFKQDNQISRTEFYLTADVKGVQRYSVELEKKEGEFLFTNNTKQAYIEVIEGKEKILIVGSSPHPDIKAIKSAIETNANYEISLFIPSIHPPIASDEKYDLVIFHQAPDRKNLNNDIFQGFLKQGTSYLIMTGSQTNLNLLNDQIDFLQIRSMGNQTDNVTAVFNDSFNGFDLSNELQALLSDFPPVTVPFGRISVVGRSQVLLHQKVGSINTSKPLLAITSGADTKGAVMLGEGIWRWKLQEYAKNENNKGFNELFTKIVQFLSSKEDRRKLRVYPINAEFNTSESVVFDSEVYNDLYERVYGNKVNLSITDEEGNIKNYSFVTNENNTQYKITGLGEGVYGYKASVKIANETETVSGEFVVNKLQIESINLTADFDLLGKIAQNTGNRFYLESETSQLLNTLDKKEAKGIIHTSESFLPLINLKWVFFLLLGLVSIEWFIRKFHGSY